MSDYMRQPNLMGEPPRREKRPSKRGVEAHLIIDDDRADLHISGPTSGIPSALSLIDRLTGKQPKAKSPVPESGVSDTTVVMPSTNRRRINSTPVVSPSRDTDLTVQLPSQTNGGETTINPDQRKRFRAAEVIKSLRERRSTKIASASLIGWLLFVEAPIIAGDIASNRLYNEEEEPSGVFLYPSARPFVHLDKGFEFIVDATTYSATTIRSKL